MKILPNITYDLSQNIIKYDEKITSLKHHSLVLCIAKNFKISKISKTWREKWINHRKVKDSSFTLQKDWRKIENFLERKLRNQLKSKSVSCEQNLNKTYTQKTIHFMGLQIIDFILTKNFSTEISVSSFYNNFVFTSQGTINTSKSVLRVVKEEFLNFPLERAKIMCHHFFGEKINEIRLTTPENLEKFYNDVDLVRDYSLYFWLCEIKEQRPSIQMINYIDNKYYKKWLDPTIKYSIVKENIFFEALETNNEMAVEYLWNNHISKMEGNSRILLNKAIRLSVDNSARINILMFLLLQVKKNEMVEFLQNKFESVIKDIIKDVRWECVFINLFELLKIGIHISTKGFLEMFALLADSCCQEYKEGMNLGTIINCFSLLDESIKTYLIKNSSIENRNPFGRIFNKAIINEEKEFIQKLGFKDCTALKDFLNSESGLNSLTEIFQKGDFSCIKKVLEEIFKEDLAGFMSFFYNKKERHIREYFVNKLNFDKLKSFVNFFLKLESEISKFKLDTLNTLRGLLIRETLFPSKRKLNKENFRRADLVLEWCLTFEENICECKRNMEISKENGPGIKFFNKMKICILNSEWDYLNEFFKWKGASVDEIKYLFLELLENESFISKIANKRDFEEFSENYKRFLYSHEAIKKYVDKFFLIVTKLRDTIVCAQMNATGSR